MKLFPVDTRDKKPKLYHLLVLSVLVLLSLAFLFFTHTAKSAGILCIIIAGYCLAATLLLLYSFREQIRYNPYSYNTILYFGFALFSLSVMVTHTVLAVHIFRAPEQFAPVTVVRSVLGSARTYITLSTPFLLAFSAALCISNFSLIAHEGKRFVNLLGIVLSLLLVAGEALIFIAARQTQSMVGALVSNLLAAGYLYFECMLLGTIVADVFAAFYEPEKKMDYIIILGCGIRKDGSLTPLLRGRADRALAFAKKQKEQTGKDLTFICSGGQGADECIPESTAIKRYLLQQGIAETQILEENQSESTLENMQFSKRLLGDAASKSAIAFSTSDYHVFRSGLFARRVKMRAVGMGAKTKWYFWPNAAVREFAGLLSKHRLKQFLIFVGMLSFYVLLTILSYSM